MPHSRQHFVRFCTTLFCLLAMGVVPALAQDTGTHVVQPGETLFRIAQVYGVDVNTLAQTNNIANSWQIYAGQTLVIPGLAPAQPAEALPVVEQVAPMEAAPAAVVPSTHTIQRGETLNSIARLYGMTPEQLIQMNNLGNPNLIYSGQQIVINSAPPPAEAVPAPEAAAPVEAAAVPAPTGTSYIVQPGEGLAQIAARHGMSWMALAQANNMSDPNRIYAGQTLIIPGTVAPVNDFGIVEAPPAPAAPAPTVGAGRSILVDLSDQRTYAYDNGVLVRNVLSSTGLPATPTVVGNFTVQRKYGAQTMSGPGYYLPDVPYVMYFYAGYAFHGTYWHNNFGNPMSHGCVNLPTPEAEWFYNFAEVGTPVTVQY